MEWTLLLTIIIGCGVVSLVNYLVFKRAYDRERARLNNLVDGFIRNTPDGGPSPLARTVEASSEILAGKVATSIKGTFMGIQSGDNRAEKALEADFMADTSPVIGAIMSGFPAVAKRLRKNPSLAPLAAELLQKLASKSGGGNGNHSEAPQGSLFPL